jgi:DNA-binding beta-propeller fold protein YncE
VWASRFSGPGRNEDDPYKVAVSPDGATVFVTGGAQGWGTGYDYATVAYSAATGRQLRASHYAGPEDGGGGGAAIAVSPDSGTVLVTGTSGGGETSDFATVAYNAADGRQLWASRYNADQANSVAVSPGGTTVYVTGTGSGGGGPLGGYATVAYRAATGRQLWATRYHVPDDFGGGAFTVAVSPARTTVYVTGNIADRSGDYYATIAYHS